MESNDNAQDRLLIRGSGSYTVRVNGDVSTESSVSGTVTNGNSSIVTGTVRGSTHRYNVSGRIDSLTFDEDVSAYLNKKEIVHIHLSTPEIEHDERGNSITPDEALQRNANNGKLPESEFEYSISVSGSIFSGPLVEVDSIDKGDDSFDKTTEQTVNGTLGEKSSDDFYYTGELVEINIDTMKTIENLEDVYVEVDGEMKTINEANGITEAFSEELDMWLSEHQVVNEHRVKVDGDSLSVDLNL